MGVFRRPELEKDNPVAPQMYVGPRRRLALARAASKSPVPVQGDMVGTLQALTDAAEQFVATVPASKKRHKERAALLKAITQAQRLLSGGVAALKGTSRGGGVPGSTDAPGLCETRPA